MKSSRLDLNGEIICFEGRAIKYKLLEAQDKKENQQVILPTDISELQKLHEKKDFLGLGNEIRKCRKKLNMTQEALARKSALSRKTISAIENGKKIADKTIKRVIKELNPYDAEERNP